MCGVQGWGWSAALKGFCIINDAELSVLEGSVGIDIKSWFISVSLLCAPDAATMTGICHTGRIRNDLSLLQATGVKVLG